MGRVELRKADVGWPLDEYEALAREDQDDDDERMDLEEPGGEGSFYAGPSSSGQERGTGTLV